MIPSSRSVSLSGLRAVHNARTRIFAAGRDPLFDRPVSRRDPFSAPSASLSTPGLAPSPDPRRAAPNRAGELDTRLWRPEILDRLQSPLTRIRE